MNLLKTWASFGMHEPENLIAATRTMADNNLTTLDRLGKILRIRELRHSLRSEIKAERESASALSTQIVEILRQFQRDYTTEAGATTMPHTGRLRHYIFLLRLENEGLSRTTTAALKELETARQDKRFMDHTLRATYVATLARTEVRLAQLIGLCEALQTLTTGTSTSDDAEDGDEDVA